MSLILFFVCLILLWIDDSRKKAHANKKISEMSARGEFLNKNYQLFNKAWQDAEDDWQHDRKLFPKEYQAYLERNPEAKKSYIEGLVGEQEKKAGNKPVLSPAYYDKNTFNPFGNFNTYKDKIKEYNETGKLYF
jgi:hypothetical protein